MFTIILILIFLRFLLYLCNFGKVGAISAVVIFCLAAHAWFCTNVSWYGEKVVAPEIEIKIQNHSWSKPIKLEPLLGEELRQDEDGNYYLTLTDHSLSAKTGDNTPNLEVSVIPANATLKKANLKFTITKAALEKQPEGTSWASLDYDNLKDQTTTLDEYFTYKISGADLRMNERPEVEPTKFIFSAKNVAGETRKTLTITRRPLYQACEFYERDHPGRIAVDDIQSCRDRATEQRKITESQTPSSSSSQNSNSNSNSGTNSSASSNSHSSTSSTCLHYESGRCWDDLELEAYSQGQYDKLYGSYGDSYYESSNCDSVCQSILEDAYDEGYSDY